MAIQLFIDYKSQVFQDYKKKKAANALPLNLSQPTAGYLKDECRIVCQGRFHKKDEATLRSFFGPHEGEKAFLKAIDACERDRFKPLANYLKELTGKTEVKNIELLAWLIDFEPRPYKWGERYEVPIPEPTGEQPMGVQNPVIDTEPEIKPNPQTESVDNKKDGTGQPQQNDTPKQKNNTKIRMAIIAVLVLIPIGLFSYWLWGNDGGCMYWTGDHYQQIPCDQKVGNALVIALDDHKLNNFKKITDISTINKKIKREVWYVKVNDTIEFYTSEGFHPTELQLRLKPVTDYIIDKYVPKTP